jgi:hypothetical protein
MKGDLRTDQFMHPIVAAQTGLRTEKHISHVFVMDVPDYPRLLLLTDMAINIAPTLAEKASIVQNAIDCAHVIGIAKPCVAILAAVEVVNPRMPSTVDAVALCKMADRGQITGGLLDGPLAFDNAINGRGRACRYSCGAGPRSRQHSGQGVHLPGGSGGRRNRPWRQRSDHLDQQGRQHPHEVGGMRARSAHGAGNVALND